MMKNNKNQDERVILARRKIQSDGFQILFVGLLISVLVQQYLFKAPLAQYAVEIVLLISMSIYVLIRNFMVGNDLFNSKKGGHKIVVINSLVCGITVSIINTILNYINYGDKGELPVMANIVLVAGITFISATASAFVVLEIAYLINRKRQKSIEAHLNKNENSNE